MLFDVFALVLLALLHVHPALGTDSSSLATVDRSLVLTSPRTD